MYKIKSQAKIILVLILATVSTPIYSQDKAEYSDFHKIVGNESRSEAIFLQCEKLATFFDSEEFNEQNGFEVPIIILEELQEASKASIESVWESSDFINLTFGKNFIKNERCLTRSFGIVRKNREETMNSVN